MFDKNYLSIERTFKSLFLVDTLRLRQLPGCKFLNTLLNSIKLLFQPISFSLKVSSFLLGCGHYPTRDPGRKETMTPAVTASPTPEAKTAPKRSGLICKTGADVTTTIAPAAPRSRTSTGRTFAISTRHDDHLLSV
jgi:hypothetical protein